MNANRPLIRPRRRTARRGTVAAAATVLALVSGACASDPEPTGSTSTAGTPHSGGKLTFAVNTVGDCLDPHVSPADVTSVIQRGVFDSLVSLTADGKVVPWLAQSWEVSPDAKTFIFHLRDDVTFHDGTKFDAGAVKVNFDHIVAKSTRSQYAVALLGSYTGTDVIDAQTVKVNFAKPYAAFLTAASTTYLGFYSPKVIETAPDTLCADAKSSVGSGPFRFTEFVKGSHATFRRNDGYRWAPSSARHAGAAYLDTLVIRILSEDATRVGGLRSGELDAIDNLPATSVTTLAESKLQVLKVLPQNANFSVYFNTVREPFSDHRVREAFQHAVDVDTIVKTVYQGQYDRAWSNLTPKNIAYDPSLEGRITHDTAKANSLLDEAGWTERDGAGYRAKNGRRLVLEWPYVGAFNRDQRDVVMQAIQADLKKVGADVQITSLESGAYTTRRNGGGYDLIAFSWGKSDPDLLRQIYASDQVFTKGGVNGSGISSPEVDGWLAAGAATTDLAARRENYAKVQNYVVDEAYTLPLYVNTRLVGARPSVHDITFDTDAFPIFYDAWVD
ncbi:ABC transporter substrate-binding protein [Parafrankia sp. EUN1f]|uniref:ABC transporter substrate-binding protein n=1 Tax=Parafrankia sp. EUN1f TaxID=102897 RepID=UPI0001C44AD8|nr:ABC transporter substrate-binding protein [Parafrankia sp. EUN1f]EFC83401.1 extracellular solute-binding protein family 5 [Parafrankia sp. EUN1f]